MSGGPAPRGTPRGARGARRCRPRPPAVAARPRRARRGLGTGDRRTTAQGSRRAGDRRRPASLLGRGAVRLGAPSSSGGAASSSTSASCRWARPATRQPWRATSTHPSCCSAQEIRTGSHSTVWRSSGRAAQRGTDFVSLRSSGGPSPRRAPLSCRGSHWASTPPGTGVLSPRRRGLRRSPWSAGDSTFRARPGTGGCTARCATAARSSPRYRPASRRRPGASRSATG